jgi:hypothetical protein
VDCPFHEVDDGFAIADLVSRFDTAADDLFGRHTVNAFGPAPHSFDATPGKGKAKNQSYLRSRPDADDANSVRSFFKSKIVLGPSVTAW